MKVSCFVCLIWIPKKMLVLPLWTSETSSPSFPES
jgi:hypothetical protein